MGFNAWNSVLLTTSITSLGCQITLRSLARLLFVWRRCLFFVLPTLFLYFDLGSWKTTMPCAGSIAWSLVEDWSCSQNGFECCRTKISLALAKKEVNIILKSKKASQKLVWNTFEISYEKSIHWETFMHVFLITIVRWFSTVWFGSALDIEIDQKHQNNMTFAELPRQKFILWSTWSHNFTFVYLQKRKARVRVSRHIHVSRIRTTPK